MSIYELMEIIKYVVNKNLLPKFSLYV